MQGAKDVQNQPSVGFSGSADGLQVNVGLPSPGGVADKVRRRTCSVTSVPHRCVLIQPSRTGRHLHKRARMSHALCLSLHGVVSLTPLMHRHQCRIACCTGQGPGRQGGGRCEGRHGLRRRAAAGRSRRRQEGRRRPEAGVADRTAQSRICAVGRPAMCMPVAPHRCLAVDLDVCDGALHAVLQGGKDISTKPVGFSGAQGLQVNVGLPSPSGVADKVSLRPAACRHAPIVAVLGLRVWYCFNWRPGS